MLGRGVRSILREPHKTTNTRSIDNAAAIIHISQLSAHAMHDTVQIHVQNEMPIGIVQILHSLNVYHLWDDTSHIDAAIELAEPLDRVGDPRVHLVDFAYVYNGAENIGFIRCTCYDLLDLLLERGGIHIRDGQLASLRGEEFGGLEADA